MSQSEMKESQNQALKQKSKLFVLCIQSEDGKIDRIFTGNDYDQLWLQGVTESKTTGGYWSTYDVQGRFIDGNFRVRSKSIK